MDFFLLNVCRILAIADLIDTSVRLLLKCSKLLRIIILIAVFLKLFLFRQMLDSFKILFESVLGDILHDYIQ